MKTAIFICMTVLTNSFLSSCALNRANSKQALNHRAGYEIALPDLGYKTDANPVRVPSKRMTVYWYPHEMASGDYFLGSYIDVELEKERWEVKNIGD